MILVIGFPIGFGLLQAFFDTMDGSIDTPPSRNDIEEIERNKK